MNHELIRTLAAIRRRLRAILVVDGLARLAAAIMGMSALLGVLDWWVHFPPLVRGSFLLAGCIWCVAWSWKRIWRPLIRPIALDQLALSLPDLPPNLRDRLAGAVAHLHGAGDGDDGLWERVLSDADAEVGKLRPLAGLNPRRAIRSSLAVIGLSTATIFATLHLPQWLHVGGRRLLTPFANVHWPRSTEIQPLTGDAYVAYGETLPVEMHLVRGDDANLRGFLHWTAGNRPTEKAMMRRDPDGVYRRVIENITSDLTYSFSAGDDETFARPLTVRVVRRPTVTSAKLLVTPPAYATTLAPHEHNLSDPRATVVQGSTVQLQVLSDKPVRLGTSTIPTSRVVLDSGRTLPIAGQGPTDTIGLVEMEAADDTAFDIVLVDERGFESRGGPRYQLEVVPDQPPVVAIKEPGGPLDATPEATIDLVIRAEDDVGITGLSLFAATKGNDASLVGDLLAPGDPSKDAPTTRVMTPYAWNLSRLRPAVGDVIEYVAEARDGYNLHGQQHKPARSAVMRLNIVSVEQFADRLRQDVLGVRGQLRKLLTGLETLRGQSHQLESSNAGADGRRERAEQLSDEARRLLQQSEETRRRFDEFNRRAEANKVGQSEAARQSQRLATRISESVIEGVKRASLNLARSVGEKDEIERKAQLAASSSALDSASASLRSMLDEVERWDSFDELVRKLHDLIDRQEGLGREVGRMARQQVDPGSPEIAKAAADQGVAAMDASKLLAAMESLAQQLAERDRPASESLIRATQAARQRSLLQTLTEATEAVRNARLSEASAGQERAASVLRAMLVALNEKPQRELEQLTRQVQDARQRLLKIIAVQEDLLQKTRSSRGTEDASSRMTLLADREASLENTTRTLSGNMKINGAEVEEAQDEVIAAADHMNTTVGWLKETEAIEAEASEQGAIDSLKKALGLLQTLEEKALQQLAEKSMAAIVESLKDIRARQAGLREQTSAIDARCKGRDTIPRADGLAMNRLSKEQQALLEPLAEVRTKIEKSVVYDYVCSQVAAAMKSAADALAAHKSSVAMEQQDLVLRDLARLIDAVDEGPPRDDPKFAAEEAGGGGANKPTPANPVPTIAELKILRMLQTELNRDTTALSQTLPPALTRTETQLKQIESLGDTQKKIHEMALKMIEKAGAQGGSP